MAFALHTSRVRIKAARSLLKCLTLRIDVMFASRSILKNKRDELSARRLALLQQLDVKPEDAGLASQLQVIDAQILECTTNMERALSVRSPLGEPEI